MSSQRKHMPEVRTCCSTCLPFMLALIKGPPYLPRGAILGLTPSPIPDIPISSVLVVLFVLSATLNMVIFQLNLRCGHKFVLSALLFGLSMARIMANVLRIAWAVHNDNARLIIAASIFANAGMLLLFVVNLILLQRVAAYYYFNYVIELVVVFTYALSRFDRRFHIPNGSKGPGDYTNGGLGGMSGQQSTDDETLPGDDDSMSSTRQQAPLKNITNEKAYMRRYGGSK